MITSSEKMPTHFNPLISLVFSSVSLKVAFEEMAPIRSLSEADFAPKIFCVAFVEVCG
jgi:hypothetical protein